MARPIPRVPPVTRQTFPLSGFMVSSLERTEVLLRLGGGTVDAFGGVCRLFVTKRGHRFHTHSPSGGKVTGPQRDYTQQGCGQEEDQGIGERD